MLHQGLALAIAVFTFLQLLRGKWPRHVLTLAAGGLMVVVVLLGVMGSQDDDMESLSEHKTHIHIILCPRKPVLRTRMSPKQ